MIKAGLRLTLGVLILAISACNSDAEPEDSSNQPAPKPQVLNAQGQQAWVDTLLSHADAAHQELSGATSQLREAVASFLAAPSADSLKTARQAWRQAHQAYKSTLLYHHLNLEHPQLDRASTTPLHHPLLSRIDRFPLEPGYLDYVQGYPFSGLVFSESVPLTAESLKEQHQFGDPNYVTLGFHAVEFLLWGENLDQESFRSWQDFIAPKSATTGSERDTARARRRQFLQLSTQLLDQDVSRLALEWRTPGGFYAKAFRSLPADRQRLLTSEALQRNLQHDVLPPLREVLDRFEDEDATISESSFSHNGKADLLATLRPIKWILLDHEGQPGDSSIPLGLTAAAQESLVQYMVRLRDNVKSLGERLFEPHHHLTNGEIKPVGEADTATVAMLDLLLDAHLDDPQAVPALVPAASEARQAANE